MSNGVAVTAEHEPRPALAVGREKPPVIVLNLFYSGLGIARDLAGTGVRVIGLSCQRHTYGNLTRRCEVRFCPNSQEDPEAFADYLLRAAGELRGAIIFPTRDADVVALDRFRHYLQPHYRLAIPSAEVLQRVMDKHALVRTAHAAGVPVPRTALVRGGAELAAAAEQVGFPCVIKPVRAVHWRGADNWNRVGGKKAFRADNLAELRSEYGRLAGVHPELLLQEWIPGPVDHIVVLGGYVGQDSQLLAYFTARKLVQSPEDFGTGCLVESVEIPGLPEVSTSLWRALEYQGMAEVEFKRDARDGEFKLIEINTRHWDWHQLGRASGINLTWAAYCHLTGRSDIPAQNSICRAKWIAEDEFLMHFVRALYHRQRRPLSLWRQLSGPMMYGIFSWNDPLPFVRYSLGLLPAFAKLALARIKPGSSRI